VEKVINRRPITCLWESSNPDGGVPIPLCPEKFLLPPREDFKEEERELDISDEFQRRKKWLSSMNDIWKKEYLHQVVGSQGEVWKTLPNPLKEREIVLVADDVQRKTAKLEDGGCPAAHSWQRWKMPCCDCPGEVGTANPTNSQTVQIGALC